jgi:hypothetical protein
MESVLIELPIPPHARTTTGEPSTMMEIAEEGYDSEILGYDEYLPN